MQKNEFCPKVREMMISSLFCHECGAANTVYAPSCFACKMPLDHSASPRVTQRLVSPQTGSHNQGTVAAQMVSPQMVSSRSGFLLHRRYTLVREIGQGGYGVVYLAKDKKRQQRLVAVKQINIGALSAQQAIDATDSYNREVALLSKLRHPQLPCISDYFTDAEHWYVVMDYIEGQTLQEILQASPAEALPIKTVIEIGMQLCDVLDYLHRQTPPVIFRDLKPENIMRTHKGRIYLIDFGIARRFVSNRARDTTSLGSPGYAAPEQYGKASSTTTRTDIYGLGATLQTLMRGKDPLELLVEETVAPSVPQRHLQALLNQMLERESRKRPKDVQEVRERLQALRHGRWQFLFARGWRRSLGTYLLWLLLGAVPYVLLYALSLSQVPFMETAGCLGMLLLLGQIIAGIVLLCTPGRRFVGMGILTVPVLLIGLVIVAIVMGA